MPHVLRLTLTGWKTKHLMEKTATGSPKIAHSLLLAIPILLLGIFASLQAFSETDMPMNIATILTIIYFTVMFVLVVLTKKTDFSFRSTHRPTPTNCYPKQKALNPFPKKGLCLMTRWVEQCEK